MNIDEGDHLDGVRVAAFLDAQLDAAERRQVEAHLEVCDRCRDEVIQVGRLMASDERPARHGVRSRLLAASAVVAAAVVMLAILQPFASHPPDPPIRAITEGTMRLEPIAPAPGSSIEGTAEFVWQSAGRNVQYRFRVTDAAGRVVATVNTADTMARLAAPDLERGANYYWHVDALLADGSSATTGLHRFQVRP